jgi:enamine deaminase RidA (YjgF/YER057c/UK114 family)
MEKLMSIVARLQPGSRLSEGAVHSGVVYLAGQVAQDASKDIGGQTRDVLASVDRLLATAGSDKSMILMAQIFLADMSDFDGMNVAWDAWVPRDNLPPRATVHAALTRPEWKIEVVITAAVK